MMHISYRGIALDHTKALKGIPMSILLVLVSGPLAYNSGCRQEPPDLSECTRLELKCPYTAMHYFFAGLDGLFSDEEKEYIQQYNSWTIEDRDLIDTFARNVARGAFTGRKQGETSPGLKITCYRDEIRITSMEVRPERITLANGAIFHYPQRLPDPSILEPPGIQRLKPRWWCALSIRGLHFVHLSLGREGRSYPIPGRWCDAVVEDLRRQYLSRGGGPRRRSYDDRQISARFRCPVTDDLGRADVTTPQDKADSAKPVKETTILWVSDYAMNPDCEPNSPPDTVLLFEARPGWNQHGGPELFTFDNHDPKGGLVLLNDGTVKFIRTDEELRQLRWK
jgi:hypothetical protein